MNYSFVFKQLSAICAMLGGCMLPSIPWAFPWLGGVWESERRGVVGLLCSIGVCFAVAVLLRRFDKGESDSFSKKEATAVVGLSWILATVLGALPYLIAGVDREEGTPMSVCDALFESQSGFSTTGATVFGELQREDLFPRCILFWRCTTHFLGGLGIMILFVVLLGYGTGTKSIVRFEMTGPSKSNPKERVQHLAKIVFRIYVGLNAVQTLILVVLGVSLYDALCHSFSTVSTGGFSTFNASAGHFAAGDYARAGAIEWTLILFMFLGGTNFMLLYALCLRRPDRLLGDPEWKTYVAVIVLATAVVFVAGLVNGDFDNYGTADRPFYVSQSSRNEMQRGQTTHPGDAPFPTAPATERPADLTAGPPEAPRESIPTGLSFRIALFQVVSFLTTTGLCTDEYEKWCGLSCCVILILIVLGGCAGSTSGGFKIIRAICVLKSLPREVELAYRPNVVRPLLVGGVPVEKETLQRIMVHLALLIVIFVAGTFFILCFEPPPVWGGRRITGERELSDAASAVISCLHNIGPGFGWIGARQNFGAFSEASKFLFAWLMMLGRLELFVILSLFHPGFWRR